MSANVINIRDAERAGARLFIVLAAISGGGKTHTALEVAYGLAKGNAQKVGLLDTENKRGSLYSDVLKNPEGKVQKFKIGDLYPPFTPQRYIDAIKAFQEAGVEVLVIDSGSHEWEGEGGCEDIAHAGNPKNPNWAAAKREHKRFLNAALQCDMHVVLCLRAREKVKLVKDGQGKTTYEPQGVMPICEKNLMFEATVSMMLWDGGKSRDVLKCPAELASIFGESGTSAKGYLTRNHGLKVRKWVDGGVQLDPAEEHARNSLRTVCEQGTAELRKAWDAQPEAMRKTLGAAFLQELLESAESYDELRAQAQAGGEVGQAAANLNESLGLGS